MEEIEWRMQRHIGYSSIRLSLDCTGWDSGQFMESQNILWEETKLVFVDGNHYIDDRIAFLNADYRSPPRSNSVEHPDQFEGTATKGET